MKHIEQIKLNFPLIFTISTIFLIFIYFPLINVSFIHHDDYRFWHPFDNMEFIESYYMSLGRYLASGIMYLYDLCVVAFPDLAMLRFLTVLAVSLSVSLTVRYLCYLGVDSLTALFFGISTFLVPAMQIGTQWLITSESIYAIIPSLSAGLLLVRNGPTGFGNISETKFFLSISFLLLLLGIVTYPASATVFLIPVLLLILYTSPTKWKNTRIRVITSIAMFLVAMISFFLLHRFIVLPRLIASGYPTPWIQDTFAITFDLLPKIKRFVIEVSPLAFNLWNVYTSNLVFYGVVLTIISGALLAAIRFVRKQRALGNTISWVSIAQIVCAVIVLIVGANFHHIFPTEGTVAFRTVISYSLIVGILFLWSFQHIVKTVLPKGVHTACFRGVVFVVMLGVGLVSQQNMLNHARNLSLEILYVRAKMSEHLSRYGRLREVHVISADYPRRDSNITYLNHPRGRDYEYLYNSFRDEWTSYVNAIFSDITKERALRMGCSARIAPDSCRENQIRVFSYEGEGRSPDHLNNEIAGGSPDRLVIDMHWLLPLDTKSPGVADLLQKIRR